MSKARLFSIVLTITCFCLVSVFVFAQDTTAPVAECAENTVTVNTYGELINAIESCTDGDTIRLPDELTISSRVDITKPLKFRPQNTRSRLIYIKSDESESKDAYPQSYYRHFNVSFSVAGGDVSFSSCDFVSDCEGYGGGIYSASRRSTLSLDNCTFDGISNTLGGALFLSHYKSLIGLSAKNCTFKNNVANKGGSIYLNTAFATIDNCTFKNNTANNDGSAVGVYNYNAPAAGVVTIDNCNFVENTTKSDSNGYAGALSFIEGYVKINSGETYSQSLGSGVVKNCRLMNNTALKTGIVSPRGSAINAENYNLSVENCEIKGNTNAGTGTVTIAYRSALPNFRISGTEISGNTVAESGGALCVLSNISGEFQVANCTFKENVSPDNKNLYFGSFDTEAEVSITPAISESNIIEVSQDNDGNSGDGNAQTVVDENKDDSLDSLWWTLGGFAAFCIVAVVCRLLYLRSKKTNSLEQQPTAAPAAEAAKSFDIAQLIQANVQKIAVDFKLSQRECEVLNGLLEGKIAKQIAGELYISFDTARFHIKNLYKKLGVHSQTELFGFCQNYK